MESYILRGLLVLPILLLGCSAVWAEGARWTLTNHAGAYTDELVRLGVDLATPYDSTRLRVLENGREVPFQVEVIRGTPAAVEEGHIWVQTSIESATRHEYEVRTDAPAAQPQATMVRREGQDLVLAGRRITLTLPDGGQSLRGPVEHVRGEGVNLADASSWSAEGLTFRQLRSEVIGAGPLFGKVRLHYTFEDADGKERFSEITLMVNNRDPVVFIDEWHDMPEGSGWTLDLSAVRPTTGLLKGWHEGPFRGNERLREVPLQPNDRLGNTIAYLQPRWTQSFDEHWFFAASNGNNLAGAIVARAGRWYWPHDNLLDVRVDDSGRTAKLFMPTWRGQRHWMLLAGDADMADDVNNIVRRLAMQHLDKLTHEYILDWPGQPDGGFRGHFFYANSTNPTGPIRGIGRNAVSNAQAGRLRGNRQLLSEFQVYLDPDWFGFYYNHWSPINPNFATDFLRIPIALAVGLKDHPEFETFRQMAEDAFRMDIDYSITLPGGAGQESPGYTVHAMRSWAALAPLCREHLGFDPTEWPRYKAAASFLLRTSQPMGNGRRRILPLGDTHPTGPDVFALARDFGINESVEDFVTEEFPGFGVVFRTHSGRNNENFLAFKAGPNRGHNHGDQLSFHYAGDGRRLAIDHMCSYAPRADQEHMHNRVWFTAGDFEFANMDGHERLIAFTTSPQIDVAVGQVESQRLRIQPRTPQEITWNPIGPYHRFDGTLTYRRTIAFVKQPDAGRGLDYFVIRDQFDAPEEVKATYALHVESGRLDRDGPTINFGTMTLFTATPREHAFERFNWTFQARNYSESTSGAFLSQNGRSGEFVTVMYPSGRAPQMESIEGGVRITFGDGQVDELIFADQADDADAAMVTLRRNQQAQVALTSGDIDLNRSQGEIGLFVPDAGYDFGPIPDWLIEQRTKIHVTTPHVRQRQAE